MIIAESLALEPVDEDDVELVIQLARDPDWSLADIAEALEVELVAVIEILHAHRDCFLEEEEGSLH